MRCRLLTIQPIDGHVDRLLTPCDALDADGEAQALVVLDGVNSPRLTVQTCNKHLSWCDAVFLQSLHRSHRYVISRSQDGFDVWMSGQDVVGLIKSSVLTQVGIDRLGHYLYSRILGKLVLDALGGLAHEINDRWPCDQCDAALAV